MRSREVRPDSVDGGQEVRELAQRIGVGITGVEEEGLGVGGVVDKHWQSASSNSGRAAPNGNGPGGRPGRRAQARSALPRCTLLS